MKKLLSYLLVAIMMLSLAACGSDSKKADKEEATQSEADVVEVLEKIDFSQIKAAVGELDITVNGEAEGEEISMTASIDFQGNNLGEDDMTLKIPVKLEAQGESIETSIYYVDGVLYADTAAFLGQNLYLELDLSDIASETDEVTQEEADEPTSAEDEAKIKEALNPQIKETGDKYIISMDLDWDKVVAMMEESNVEDMETVKAMDVKTFKLTMSCTKDGVMDEITFDVDASVEVEGTTVNMTMKGSVSFKTGSVDISLPSFDGYMDASGLLGQMFAQ